MIALDTIRAAQERIAPHLLETPCIHSPTLSDRYGCEVLLKCENLQRTGAFKARGALNRVLQIEPEVRSRGVLAASAGNHSQGVAFAAAEVGIPALIVMPEATPLVRVTKTRSLGAEVQLFGDSFDDANAHAVELAAETGMTFVHPFDDREIIAGHATLGLEILRQVPDVEVVIASIGGGGLLAGIASAIRGLGSEIPIYGVQTESAPSMQLSFEARELTEGPVRPTLAEGISVRRPASTTSVKRRSKRRSTPCSIRTRFSPRAPERHRWRPSTPSSIAGGSPAGASSW